MYPSRHQNIEVNSTYRGIGFFGLLTIVLVALKLTGYANISWWWVFSPIFVAIGIWIVVVAFIVGLTIWLNK